MDLETIILATDCVVLGIDDYQSIKVLLIQANSFENTWSLPGGRVQFNESIDQGAARKLFQETGLENVFLEQLYTFGDLGRDPRSRVVSVGYYSLIHIPKYQNLEQLKNSKWVPLSQIPPLAFDHNNMVQKAMERLRGKISYTSIVFELLDHSFTMSELQKVYELILNKKLDKRNFIKKMKSFDILNDLNEFKLNLYNRKVKLHSFNQKKYQEKLNEGFNLSL
ncbi:NUDIX hydrolase [bacterium]|nr:NUDIX hydrolase [bacterium]